VDGGRYVGKQRGLAAGAGHCVVYIHCTIAQYRTHTVPYSHCTVLTLYSHCAVPHCTVLTLYSYCTVLTLCCTALCCTILQVRDSALSPLEIIGTWQAQDAAGVWVSDIDVYIRNTSEY
jgi:hypothetical protein